MDKKWEIIVSSVKKNKYAREEDVQKLWESFFIDSSIFGYSKYLGEVDSQRNFFIGSRERTIPDIIVKSFENDEDLFVVELKQHNLPFKNEYKMQLFSYMKLLDVKAGMLICDKIYLYTINGKDEKNIIIPFDEKDVNGNKFVNLFTKGNFNLKEIEDFIVLAQKYEANIQHIKKELECISLKNLVKNYFLKTYNEEEVNIALSDYNFQILFNDLKMENEILTNTIKINKVHKISPENSGEKIQDYVKRVLTFLFINEIISEDEINALHDKEYSKQTFNIEYPLLCDNEQNINYSGHNRYWLNWKLIDKYYVCSQWWKENTHIYENLILKWLNRVFPDYENHGLTRKIN